jgi:hypothetical protein
MDNLLKIFKIGCFIVNICLEIKNPFFDNNGKVAVWFAERF